MCTARDTLDALKESAQQQADSGFDPSGTGGALNVPNDDRATSQAESCPGTFETRTSDTGLSSLSNDLRSLDVSSQDGSAELPTLATSASISDLDNANDAEKATVLQEMFPSVKEYSILYTLQKSHGNVDRAMDELLNHAFLESGDFVDGEQPVKVHIKGVEAFSEENTYRRRKAKKKKNKWNGHTLDDDDARRSSSLPTSPTRPSTGSNTWQSGLRDMNLIAEYTHLPRDTVSSVFYKNGASTSGAITAILGLPLPSSHPNANVPDDDPAIIAHAYELGQTFTSIPRSRLASLVRLTHPSTSAAHDLARMLTTRNSAANRIEIVPRYETPPSTQGDNTSWSTVASPTSAVQLPATNGRRADPMQAAATHSALSSRAYAQAQSAYRRGRSDHLMGGAAAYYSQVGRDHAAAASEARGQAADDLVNAQSSTSIVDLHGVSVKDAIRIGRDRTERWWRTSGRGQMGLDGRIRRGGEAGALEIVTGVGRHSRGGKAMIGPAVGRMLLNEGWSVRFEEGLVVVTGKRG